MILLPAIIPRSAITTTLVMICTEDFHSLRLRPMTLLVDDDPRLTFPMLLRPVTLRTLILSGGFVIAQIVMDRQIPIR